MFKMQETSICIQILNPYAGSDRDAALTPPCLHVSMRSACTTQEHPQKVGGFALERDAF